MLRVLIWNEFRHEKTNPSVESIYPNGIHEVIKEFLQEKVNCEIHTATLDDPECGNVFRIKGFVKADSGKAKAHSVSAEMEWLELNATRREFSLKPVSVGQEVVIVIGENMNKERIQGYLKR